MKDARGFAKTAEIRFNTRNKETADAVSGKNVQYKGVSACFAAGTQVKTAEGDKNIEDVVKGDYVLAENPETGEQEYKQVVQTFVHKKYLLVHVYVEDEEIITTEEHPFYVEGTGFVCAGELKCGDTVRLADGRKVPVKQAGFEYLDEPVLVYNFEVEDFNTYYVSELGVLVHNTCMVETGGENFKQIDGTSYDINKLRKTQSYIDKSVVESMKKSIMKQGPGAVPPIRVRVHDGEALIVQSHHRLEAFKQLGYQRVPIKYVHKSQLGKIQSDGDYFRTIEELLAGKIYD